MAILKLAASVTNADLIANNLFDTSGNLVSTTAESKYIVVMVQGKPTLTDIATAPTLSQLSQDLQIQKRVEALPFVPNIAALLTLTYGTVVDSGQVQAGDVVPVGTGAATEWYIFCGSSQADIANQNMWKKITPSGEKTVWTVGLPVAGTDLTTTWYGPPLHQYVEDIQAACDSLVAGYTVQTVDLSGF